MGSVDDFQRILDEFDKLRSIFKHDREIKLPTIVVIGDQSHGKSSLLESISGIDLPKGKGMKTKLPLEMRMRCLPDDEKAFALIECPFRDTGAPPDDDKTGANGQTSFEMRIEINQISAAIEDITNKVAGTDQSVKDQPIILTVYQKDMVDLTLVDLPGLMRNPAPNSGKDVQLPKTIYKMAQRYISNEEAIILNVLNVTVDAETCESLGMAAVVDPKRRRTIVAYSFVDMYLDDGLLEKFEGMQRDFGFPPHQIFLTRSRKEEENNSAVLLSEVQAKEKAFFEAPSKYHDDIPKRNKGSSLLQRRLADMQKEKILATVPSLRSVIYEREARLTEEDRRLGAIGTDPSQFLIKYQSLLSTFFQEVKELIDGFHTSGADVRFSDAYICAEGMDAWNAYKQDIYALMPFSAFFSSAFFDKLHRMSRATRGFRALPDEIHPQIAVAVIRELSCRLEEPSQQLVRTVSRIMQERAREVLERHFVEFPTLRRHVQKQLETLLAEKEKQAFDRVLEVLSWQKNRPFTLSPDYSRITKHINTLVSDRNFGNVSPQNPSNAPTVLRVVGLPSINGVYVRQPDMKNGKNWYCAMLRDMAIFYHEKGRQWIFKHREERAPAAFMAYSGGYNVYHAVHNGNALMAPPQAEHEGKDSAERPEVKDKEEFVQHRGVQITPVSYAKVDTVHQLEYLEILNSDMAALWDFDPRLRLEAAKIAAYWRVVVHRIIDDVPLCIWHHVVDGCVTAESQELLFKNVLRSAGVVGLQKQLRILMKPDEAKVAAKKRVRRELVKVDEFKDILEHIEQMLQADLA